MQGKTADILLVEDNPGDVRLTQEALRESKLANHLTVAEDGDIALQMLRQQPPYAEQRRPDLILLDLNLPRIDGREVLKEVKTDPELRTIPVVILTTSVAERDVLRGYELHANCYISKPVDLIKFEQIVQMVGSYWFALVTLPPK